MTRVMLVDDEMIFCDYLKTLLNWEKHGYTICAIASGGQQAIHMLKDADPDIVITDIQMAEVDGLSLISHINEHYPHVQVIALSGYDEYQYVRSSLRNGVVDYLLKHQTTSETLLAAVKAAAAKITLQRRKEIVQRHQEVQMAKGKKVLRRAFIADLLAGKIKDKTEVIQLANELKLNFNVDCFIVAAAEIDNMVELKEKYSDNEWYIFFERMIEILETIASQNGGCLILPQYESRFTALFYMEKSSSLLQFYNHVQECIHQIRLSLKQHCNVTACYSISSNIYELEKIPAGYQKTCVALRKKVFHGNDVVLKAETSNPIEIVDTHYSISAQEEHKIMTLFRANEWNALQAQIEQIFRECQMKHVVPTSMQIVFATLVNILTRLARMDGVDVTEIEDFNKLFEKYRYMKLSEMKEYILKCYCFLMQKRQAVKGESKVVVKACRYIEKNFAENISLSEIAREFCVNPSYLSRIFKKETGQTVVEYLNSVRIAHAKHMIEDGINLDSLSREVGFNSKTYFFTVFKHMTGKTPLQFKKEKIG